MILAYKGGRFMDAQRAYQLGIVNEVVPEGELLEAAERWAEMLKTIPQLYIKAIKYGHYKAAHMDYLQREMDYVNFIWPQQGSDERNVEGHDEPASLVRAGLEVDPHGEKAPTTVERHFGRDQVVAPLRVAEEVLGALGNPLDRPL